MLTLTGGCKWAQPRRRTGLKLLAFLASANVCRGEPPAWASWETEVHRNVAEQWKVPEAAAPAGPGPGKETEGCRCTSRAAQQDGSRMGAGLEAPGARISHQGW